MDVIRNDCDNICKILSVHGQSLWECEGANSSELHLWSSCEIGISPSSAPPPITYFNYFYLNYISNLFTLKLIYLCCDGLVSSTSVRTRKIRPGIIGLP